MDSTSRDRDAVLAFGERTLRESFAALEPLGSGKILKKGEADYVTASDYALERIHFSKDKAAVSEQRHHFGGNEEWAARRRLGVAARSSRWNS